MVAVDDGYDFGSFCLKHLIFYDDQLFLPSVIRPIHVMSNMVDIISFPHRSMVITRFIVIGSVEMLII